MARIIVGGLSFQRTDEPTRTTVSIVAQEVAPFPNVVGYFTHIDGRNRNYGLRLECLNINPEGTRVIFAGRVTMTTNPAWEGDWLLAEWEKVGEVWTGRGNWTGGETNPGCEGLPATGAFEARFTADAGALSIREGTIAP